MLSFGVVKTVLRSYGLTADVDDPALRQSLRLIWPLDRSLADTVRSQAASLTDSATSEDQIRFFQGQRAQRSYVKIARWITSQRGAPNITIDHAEDLDEPSADFFRTAAEVAGWQISCAVGGAFSAGVEHDEQEAALLRWLHPDEIRDHLGTVWSTAFDYVNAGDAWTAAAIGRRLAEFEQTPRVWNLLALSFAMLGQTEVAEFYYRKWAADGDSVDKIKALYGIAMLYARHHPAGLRDLDTAARMLEEAHDLVTGLSPERQEEPALVFESVFNRNGFALILFRRGDVSGAFELLRSGIARLTSTTEKVAIHRSVLMYNLAQCHRQMGDLDAAIAAYEDLLRVDPHMAEYHLEQARCLAAAGQPRPAVDSVGRALELDDTLPVAWALLGLYLGQCGDDAAAADAYEHAATLAPRHTAYFLDHAYFSLFSGRPDAALRSLAAARPTGPHDVERHATLEAEALMRIGDRPAAALTLERALVDVPGSATLQANLLRLRAA